MCFMPKQPEAPIKTPDYAPGESELGVKFKQTKPTGDGIKQTLAPKSPVSPVRM